jgi:hypothetical protein
MQWEILIFIDANAVIIDLVIFDANPVIPAFIDAHQCPIVCLSLPILSS